MRISLVIITFLCHSVFAVGQEEININLIDVDSTWGQEIFHFPINFAKDIDFEGVEEARFPRGWSTPDTNTYWSYAFAWSIDHEGGLSESELEENIKKYFDGLMGNKNRARADSLDSATAAFIKQGVDQGITQYIGKVKTFDAFFTQEIMTLYAVVDQYHCPQEKKTFILFRFSPKGFENEVWLKLNKLKLYQNLCG